MAPSTTTHVPAWKKLGLQLKTAKEDSDNSKNKQSARVTEDEHPVATKSSKKRSRSEENEQSAAKKQRLGNAERKSGNKPSQKKSRKLEKSTSTEAKSTPPPKSTNKDTEKATKLPKTVSFSSDTKLDDGAREAEATPNVQQELLTSEQRRAEKRKKREQRAKSRQVTQIAANEHKTAQQDPILSYISVFYNSRSQWKFQKNRETALLRNVFSIDKIPSTYNPALSAYLEGLRGEGARKRVTEAAEQALEAEKAELEKIDGQDPERKKYDEKVSAFEKRLTINGGKLEEQDMNITSDLDPSWSRRLEKRIRAELVYFLMCGRVPTTNETKNTSNPPSRGEKRKRKSRTIAPEDISSDSESDSDEPVSSKGLRDAKKFKQANSSTSSSDSSSESSKDSSSNSPSDSSSDSSGSGDSSSDSSSNSPDDTSSDDSEESTDSSNHSSNGSSSDSSSESSSKSDSDSSSDSETSSSRSSDSEDNSKSDSD
ncbi:hypothetical protein VTO42DRAFT_5346 [Malbranchea cinnamomea]